MKGLLSWDHLWKRYYKTGFPGHIEYVPILFFIKYLKQTGHFCITSATRNDLSGFIEQKQDRGLMPGTIATTLRALYSFLAYLADQGIVSFELLRKKFREVMGKHFL